MGLYKKDIQQARLVVLFSTRRSGVGDFVATDAGDVYAMTPMFTRQRHPDFANVQYASVSSGRDGRKNIWLAALVPKRL